MHFKPFNDVVIAQPQKAKEKSDSGILLGEGTAREQPRIAIVVAVGPNVKQAKVGDRILFQAFATTDIKVKDELYIALSEEFVLSTIDGGAEVS